MCKNFILIKYAKSKFDRPVDEEMGNLYLRSQEEIFRKMVKQLTIQYPDSYIHVLTNEKMLPVNNKMKIHKRDFEPNHLCKLLLYGLLTEPGLYLDADIIIKRKFHPHELKSSNAFRMYNSIGRIDYSRFSRNLNCSIEHYNAGAIMIAEPSEELAKEMLQIQEFFFSDKEFKMANGSWPYCDEHVASYYIHKNKWTIEPNNTVSLFYPTDNPDVQSVHHTGLDKRSFFLDFSITYTKLF